MGRSGVRDVGNVGLYVDVGRLPWFDVWTFTPLWWCIAAKKNDNIIRGGCGSGEIAVAWLRIFWGGRALHDCKFFPLSSIFTHAFLTSSMYSVLRGRIGGGSVDFFLV